MPCLSVHCTVRLFLEIHASASCSLLPDCPIQCCVGQAAHEQSLSEAKVLLKPWQHVGRIGPSRRKWWVPGAKCSASRWGYGENAKTDSEERSKNNFRNCNPKHSVILWISIIIMVCKRSALGFFFPFEHCTDIHPLRYRADSSRSYCLSSSLTSKGIIVLLKSERNL